jgi:glyoxylase-like metal-dependent hydrolase (beta-lactamase superfamily II)
VFDGQFFLPYAEEAATYIDGLAKPVDRIVLSHIHLDHWSGLPVFAKRFPDAPICGLPGVSDYLRANGQRILDARRSAFGDKIPSRPPVLNAMLPEGAASIDGIRFEFKRFIDAESALQLVALMPEQQTMLGFDLVFGPNDHVFTVTAHFENWIAILEGLIALPGYNRILSGHGEPTVPFAINATIAYLRKAKEVHAATNDPLEYASRMKAIFHDRRNPGWVDISGSLLYEVVTAYVTD